jgi:uncharacterized membrane protein YedE/YeeE
VIHSILVSLLGGVLIGLAVALLFLGSGRVAGISGILAGLVRPASGDWTWRVYFVVGLLAGGLGARIFAPSALGPWPGPSWHALVLSGALVGFGARMAQGCTSGHGVCGVSRLAPRSLLATGTFMATAALVVFWARHGAAR